MMTQPVQAPPSLQWVTISLLRVTTRHHPLIRHLIQLCILHLRYNDNSFRWRPAHWPSTKLSEASQTSKKKQTATHFIWRIQVWDRLLCRDLPTGWIEFKEKLWLLSQDSYPVVDFSTVSFNVLVTRIAWQVILPEVRHFISSNHGGCLRKYSYLVFRWIQICLHRISALVYDVSIYSIES